MHISKIKKIIITMLAVSTIFCTVFTASGLTAQMVTTRSGATNSITATFAKGYYGTGEYGTKRNKIVKNCYVRLKEGSYDSKRVWSKSSGNGWYKATTSKSNQLFKTCYTYYGWTY